MIKTPKKDIFILKFDAKKDDYDLVMKFYSIAKEGLEEKYEVLLVPNAWKVSLVKEKFIHIKLDLSVELGTSEAIFKTIKENIGAEYTVICSLCDAEIIETK